MNWNENGEKGPEELWPPSSYLRLSSTEPYALGAFETDVGLGIQFQCGVPMDPWTENT